jgi:hypothetical protein
VCHVTCVKSKYEYRKWSGHLMIELGKMQSLIVVRKAPEGLYLNAKGAGDGQAVLLPREEAPQDINTGAELEVFVYADPESGMFATLKRPKLVLGELGQQGATAMVRHLEDICLQVAALLQYFLLGFHFNITGKDKRTMTIG